MPKRKQEPRKADKRPATKPKTRNVFVKLPKSEVTRIRRACLDIVHDRKTKGGIVVRVPSDAKRVKVSATKERVEVSFNVGKKRVRRVDTPIKAFDWAKTESEAYLRQGRKKGERLTQVKIAVRGYDSLRFHSPATFGRYVDERFLPSVSRMKGKKNKPKRDVCNYYAVRRIYVSTHKRKTQGKGPKRRR